MKCPICGNEMERGRVDASGGSTWGTTIQWYTEEDCSQPFLKKPFLYAKYTYEFSVFDTRNDFAPAYYCKNCHKVIAVFDINSYDSTEVNEYAQVLCPKCGKTFDFDYPECPYCKHSNIQ